MDNDNDSNILPSISISVVLSRQKQQQKNPRIAVATCVPRKRDGLDDPVRFSLTHYSFLDDSRSFTNLSALLNRLGNVNVAHVGCTETIEAPPKCSNPAVLRKIKEVNNVLNKLIATISPFTSTGNDNTNNISTHNLPKSLITGPTSRLDSHMQSLLGSETSPQHLAYRGNRALSECQLSQLALCLLIQEGGCCDLSSAGEYEVLSGSLHSHLNIDGTASDCINLLPPKNAGVASLVGGNAGNNSLYGVLNHTKTKMGARLLEVWLRQPLVDLQQIEARLNVVESLVNDGTGRDALRGIGLKGLCDLDRLCFKLNSTNSSNSTHSLEQLYQAYLFVDQQLPAVIRAMEDMQNNISISEGILKSSLKELKEVCVNLGQLTQLVEAVLDFDAAPLNYLVRPDFDERLVELKGELNNIDHELKETHDNMDHEWSEISGQPSGQVRLETVSSSTTDNKDDSCCWQFRLAKTNAEKTLRTELPHVNVHRLLKNGVYFSTKQLRQLGTQKQDIMTEYVSKQKVIVRDAMAVAATYVPVLEKASATLAQLDVLASFAHVTAYSPHTYCRPTMTDSDDKVGITLERARHPCVELQEGMEFIPNDFNLVHGSSSFLLLTGPNMGGKSTFIRSLGAVVTMAQVGSFVPAESATINIVDKILARVGAGDVQQRGISTFMAEMLEASSILQRATKRSLIIIDELGRGTSTFDGFGLAWAISEYIVKKVGAITVFATHFHELTRLEETEESVKNFHVSAEANSEQGELTFLYEVKPGPCLESFGIQVAEMANVPPTVIEDAKRKARELESFDYRKKHRGENSSSFVDKFRKIPLRSMSTREEKLEALRKLCQ